MSKSRNKSNSTSSSSDIVKKLEEHNLDKNGEKAVKELTNILGLNHDVGF